MASSVTPFFVPRIQRYLFRTRDDYVYGMNLVAWAASNFNGRLKILTFQIMSNHLHFVLACDRTVKIDEI